MASSRRLTIHFVSLAACAMFAATAPRGHAQSAALVPVKRTVPATSAIDETTRWAFRAKASVTVDSPIVRLADLVEPISPGLVAWSRLSHAVVGLVPLDGTAMVVDRGRLAEAISRAEATPLMIQWSGAEKIRVTYQPSLKAKLQPAEQAVPEQAAFGKPAFEHGGPDHVAAFRQPQADPLHREETAAAQPQATASPVAPASAVAPVSPVAPVSHQSTATEIDPIDPRTADRIVGWTELAIERSDQSVFGAFEVQIDRDQPTLASLQNVSGITEVAFDQPPTEGENRLRVTGRSAGGPVEAMLIVTLRRYPQAVVAREPLRRGHRIAAADLERRPVRHADWDESLVTDPQSLVGMEVQDLLRRGQPISSRSVGPPTLIHRGDLVELRVVGGGVRVTTNARALADGGEADLVEVETMQPRRKYLARVVAPGLVEIITRAPRTRP